jgi:hypothetical protein
MEWATRIEVIRPLFTPRAHLESDLMQSLGERGIVVGELGVRSRLYLVGQWWANGGRQCRHRGGEGREGKGARFSDTYLIY